MFADAYPRVTETGARLLRVLPPVIVMRAAEKEVQLRHPAHRPGRGCVGPCGGLEIRCPSAILSMIDWRAWIWTFLCGTEWLW